MDVRLSVVRAAVLSKAAAPTATASTIDAQLVLLVRLLHDVSGPPHVQLTSATSDEPVALECRVSADAAQEDIGPDRSRMRTPCSISVIVTLSTPAPGSSPKSTAADCADWTNWLRVFRTDVVRIDALDDAARHVKAAEHQLARIEVEAVILQHADEGHRLGVKQDLADRGFVHAQGRLHISHGPHELGHVALAGAGHARLAHSVDVHLAGEANRCPQERRSQTQLQEDEYATDDGEVEWVGAKRWGALAELPHEAQRHLSLEDRAQRRRGDVPLGKPSGHRYKRGCHAHDSDPQDE
eukprot:scaffold9268_cov125-Isochrysis_galbana.AAC.5